MDTNTLLCVIEILGAILIAVAVVAFRNWASFQQPFDTIRETTRATRPQWVSMLAGILGANFGYIIIAGAISLKTWAEDATEAETFGIPVAAAVYFFCAIPTCLTIGAICGLLIFRFTQRRAMGTRASVFITLAAASILGATIAMLFMN